MRSRISMPFETPILAAFSALALSACMALSTAAWARPGQTPGWTPDAGPQSSEIEDDHGLSLPFCQKWNPEFAHQGFVCCADPFQFTKGRRRPSLRRCDPKRFRGDFCHEMTDEEREYSENAQSGAYGDLLDYLKKEIQRREQQSFCGVNNGFLVNGRRVIATASNQIRIQNPQRCTNFGTTMMAAMLEWLGREIAKEYPLARNPSAHLLIGDISPPRGGCMPGRGGRRGHSSHTAGRDVDIGFLVVKSGKGDPSHFHKDFDADAEWWLIKKILQNPFVCVSKVFLDRKWIAKLARVNGADPYWKEARRFIQHIKYHKNHIHVRVGENAGPPGCRTEDEDEVNLMEDLIDLPQDGATDPGAGDGVPDGTEGATEVQAPAVATSSSSATSPK